MKPIIALLFLLPVAAAISISTEITYPTSYTEFGIPKQIRCDVQGNYVFIWAKAIDDGNTSHTRSLSCNRYDEEAGLQATITHAYTNNTNTTFNFTLNASNSGNLQFFNCTALLNNGTDNFTATTSTEAILPLGVSLPNPFSAIEDSDFYFPAMMLTGCAFVFFGNRLILEGKVD